MIKHLIQSFFITTFTCVLMACNDGMNYAPVTELSAIEPVPVNGIHQVQPGETLYEIAWRYGLDYRYLAARNQIPPPYTIHVRDKIAVLGKTATPVTHEAPSLVEKPKILPQAQKTLPMHLPNEEPRFRITHWIKPANGPVIGLYSAQQKGINIAGHKGDAIMAAAAGKVVYSGNGLKRYGQLIILKHNHLYLSAYAHNQHVLVQEGDWVQQGQKIAEMGSTGTNRVMLHFEIRKAGRPVNPSYLLGS